MHENFKSKLNSLENQMRTKHDLECAVDYKSICDNCGLSHYTSLDGLKGIIENQYLRMGAFHQLNDPQEIYYGIKQYCDYLKSSNLIFHPEDKIFENTLEKILEEALSCHILSFCKNSDHLPAWRYYADNGYGFSLQFQKFFFKPEKYGDINTNLGIYRIKYETINQYNSFFEEYKSNITKLKDLINNNDELVDYSTMLAKHILICAQGLKDPIFKDENEYRLFMLREKVKVCHDIIETIPYHNNHVFSRGCIGNKKFFKFKFDVSNIKSITIGPSNDFEQAQNYLKTYLSQHNVLNKIAIVKSKYLYRG